MDQRCICIHPSALRFFLDLEAGAKKAGILLRTKSETIVSLFVFASLFRAFAFLTRSRFAFSGRFFRRAFLFFLVGFLGAGCFSRRRLVIGRVKARTFKNDLGGRDDFLKRFLAAFRAILQRHIGKRLMTLELHTTRFTTISIDWHFIFYLLAFLSMTTLEIIA
jgi:hypothetical protein